MRGPGVLLLCVILSSSAFTDTPANSRPWEFSRTISGIQIFHRRGTAGGIHEFLAVTELNLPADYIKDTVLDIPTNRYWMADCIHSEFITGLQTGEIIAYYITSPPWPLKKRDTIVRIRTIAEPVRITFTMTSLPEGEAEAYKPLDSDCLRIYRMEGRVILDAKGPAVTEIKFSVAGEPGGIVPGAIVRLGGWVIPYRTLTGLKKFTGQ